jgi:hypothetical protein
MTTFPPPIGPPMIDAMPPMWNSGPAARLADWRAGAAGRAASTDSRADANAMFQRFATWARFVAGAPFGRPVVPDV